MAITTAANEQLLDLIGVRQLAKSGAARGIRTAAGLSLADVGGAIGVAAATVQRWENGLRRPYGEAALRYGALLEALAKVHASEDDKALLGVPTNALGHVARVAEGGSRSRDGGKDLLL